MDDLVAKALHAVRHHLAGGGFLSDLFSGPDYLSTGEVASPTNWGDPESAADFFKADKARMAQQAQARDEDVTASIPQPSRRAPAEPVHRPQIAAATPAPAPQPEAAFRRVETLPGDEVEPHEYPVPEPMAIGPYDFGSAVTEHQFGGNKFPHFAEQPGFGQSIAERMPRADAQPEVGSSELHNYALPAVALARQVVAAQPEIPTFEQALANVERLHNAGIYSGPELDKAGEMLGAHLRARDAGIPVEEAIRLNQIEGLVHTNQGMPQPAPAPAPEPKPMFRTQVLSLSGEPISTPAVQPLQYTAAPAPAPAQAATTAAMPAGEKFNNRIAAQPGMTDLTPQQTDYIIRTIAAESSGHPEESKGIANVIMNRINSGRFGATPEHVLFNKRQFEPWGNKSLANYPLKIKPGTDRYQAAAEALDAALQGEDNTGGATFFWGPGSQYALGRDEPSWARKFPDYTDIGATRFHRETREEGGEINGDGNMSHDDIVAHALHRLRRHFDGSDGSYVDPMGSIAIPAAGPAPEQAPVVMENAERARAAEERARLAADIKAYEASNARIQEQPEWTRAMTHGPEEPRAPVTIDAFGRERVLGHAPYKTAAPLSSLAQFGYGLKTAPIYAAGMAFPPAAALGTAIDTAEGFASGSPTQVAMGAIGGPFKTARNVFGPLAVASGLTAPDEAEAARVPKIGGALSGAARAELSRVAPKAVDPSLEKAFDIVRSATADDAGQAVKTAKQVAGPPQRGILATPDLRQIDRDEAIRVARSEPHLIQDANGQYVGAPRGMTTPEQIQAMREAFDKDVEAGAVGGDWYERAREFNREVSGNDPYRQKLIANEEALWSAQANPDTNLGFGLNARTDYEAGKYGDKYRTGQQARSYEEARRAMDLARSVEAERGMMGHNQGPALTDIEVEPSGLSRLGKKTGIYGQHLDPTVAPATTGTNDIWHARGFGYTNQDGTLFSRALTPQEHRFLDYETMLAVDRANAANLAGRSDWTGAEIQAAPWVAGKGRALAQRGNKPLEQGIAEAAQTYPDVAPKYTYSTPIEQIPGANTGLLPNLINADDATKAAFTARANWKDSNGRDALWSELGMPTRYTNDTLGAYRNSAGNVEFNPLEIGRPMSGFGLNEAGNPVANPRMAAGLSMGQAARGLLDFQEGTPWNKFITHGAGPDKTSIHVGIGRNPTREELDALMQLGQKHGLDLTNTEGGVGFINFKDNQTTTSVGKDLKAGLLKEIKSILPDATVQRARFQGDYFDLAESGVNQLAKENQGKGLATKKLFDNLSDLRDTAPDYYKRILDSESISAKARANLDRLMESGGKGQRPDYERLLKIVGEDGLRGLLDRVTKLGYRGLPAIGGMGTAGAVLNSSASKDGSEPGRYD